MQRNGAVLLTGLGLAILVGCLVLSTLLWGGVRGIQADVSAQRSELAAMGRRLSDAVTAIENLRSSLNEEVAARSSSIAGLEGKLDADTAALSEVRADHDMLRSQVVATRTSGAGLRVAYVNAEDAFTVFTNAVSSLRQKALDKRSEITKLQSDFMQSAISKDQYQRQLNQLNVELVDAQLDIDVGTIDRMIASAEFSDIRADLEKLREAAQPVVEEVKNLVATARLGVVDSTDFQSRLSQVQSAFQQLDTLLTQAATLKIQQAAAKIAVRSGYDLVIPTKNVIVYADQSAIPDITNLVKAEIATYL